MFREPKQPVRAFSPSVLPATWLRARLALLSTDNGACSTILWPPSKVMLSE